MVLKPELLPAIVERNQLSFTFGQPYAYEKNPIPNAAGFYVWRISVETSPGIDIVLAADTVVRTNNLRDIVRTSRLRLCRGSYVKSALECTDSLQGRVQLYDNAFRLVVLDSAVVARIRTARPAVYWRYVFLPDGRFRLERVPIEYHD